MSVAEKIEAIMDAGLNDIMERYGNIEYANAELLENESYVAFSDASVSEIEELLTSQHPSIVWVDDKAAVRAVFDRLNNENNFEELERLTKVVAKFGECGLYEHYRDLLCDLENGEEFIDVLEENK